TLPTGTRQLHLVWGPFPAHTRFVEQVPKVCGAWLGVDGLPRLGDTATEHPPVVERLAQGRVIDSQSPSDRVDRGRLWPADPGEGVLDLVKQGPAIAGIARIAHRDSRGQEKARRGLRDAAGCAPQRGRAIALALHKRGQGGIVGLAALTVGQLLALGQPGRWWADLRLRRLCRAQCSCPALPRGRAQMWRLLEGAWGASCASAAMALPRSNRCGSGWRTSFPKILPGPRHWRPKRCMTFCRACWRAWAWLCSVVVWVRQDETRWRPFFEPCTGWSPP